METMMRFSKKSVTKMGHLQQSRIAAVLLHFKGKIKMQQKFCYTNRFCYSLCYILNLLLLITYIYMLQM